MKKFTTSLVAFIFTIIVFSGIFVAPVSAGTAVDSAVAWAVSIANDNSHGYDQTYRWGPNYDCSALIITAYQRAGIPVKTNGASYTGNMYSAFTRTGFTNVKSKINLSTGAGLRKGDVLLIPSKHTVMVSSVVGGKVTIVHASINEKGTATGGRSGDQTGREICTRSYYNGGWTYVLRHNSSTSAPQPTPVPNTGTYFKRYTGTSGSIVTALNAIGVNSTYDYRAKIAAANGISGYSGTAAQNTKMLSLLKQGLLRQPSTTTISYFPRYTGTSVSIVNALAALRIDSSYAYRTKIAAKNGISNYSGTPTQNTQMLNLLKQGKLRKP